MFFLKEGNFQAGAKEKHYSKSKKKVRTSFCEQKESRKNFINFCFGLFQYFAKRTKSFLVLFFKKELLVFIAFFPSMSGLGITKKDKGKNFFLFTKRSRFP